MREVGLRSIRVTTNAEGDEHFGRTDNTCILKTRACPFATHAHGCTSWCLRLGRAGLSHTQQLIPLNLWSLAIREWLEGIWWMSPGR